MSRQDAEAMDDIFPGGGKIVSQIVDVFTKMFKGSNLPAQLTKELGKVTQKGASNLVKAIIEGVKGIFDAIVKFIESIRRVFDLIAGSMVMLILLMIAVLILVLVTIAFVVVQMMSICKSMWES